MVSLVEAVKLPPKRDPRLKCGVGDWIRSLPEAEQQAAAVLLADNERRNPELTELFQQNGMNHKMNAVGKHRRGECSCPR